MEHAVRLGKGRGTFVGLLEGAAGRHGVDVAWFCDEWVAELGRGGRRGHVIGYAFPLNNFAAGQLARDKVAAARLLGRDGVPRVAHELVR
ncbi:MAG TPA: hypothetical protein VFQ76_07410, partial [Longimicrobiaceae bacterium]|nr:hypothetical protein [Longimicrobiaceae bacterium]